MIAFSKDAHSFLQRTGLSSVSLPKASGMALWEPSLPSSNGSVAQDATLLRAQAFYSKAVRDRGLYGEACQGQFSIVLCYLTCYSCSASLKFKRNDHTGKGWRLHIATLWGCQQDLRKCCQRLSCAPSEFDLQKKRNVETITQPFLNDVPHPFLVLITRLPAAQKNAPDASSAFASSANL